MLGHQVASFGGQGHHVRLFHAGVQVGLDVEPVANSEPYLMLDVLIFRQNRLKWLGHVADVGFGRVVKQGHQLVLSRYQTGND